MSVRKNRKKLTKWRGLTLPNKVAIFPDALRMTDSPLHQCLLSSQQPSHNKPRPLVFLVTFPLKQRLPAAQTLQFLRKYHCLNFPHSESDVIQCVTSTKSSE
jgi:hypothetical protein